MDKIFKISELISTDIRSRANANIIRSAIDGINERIVLDFDGVCFISRSFTDELYNVLEEHKNISFTNTSDNIKAMLDAVEKGRKSTRNFSNSSEIKEFHDFASNTPMPVQEHFHILVRALFIDDSTSASVRATYFAFCASFLSW